MNLSNINLNLLKYFFDAARTGSLTLAAEKNHVSRPAVSQAITRLEDSLGFRLTAHTKRQLILTDKGHLVAKQCESIFHAVDNLGIEISKSSNVYSGPINMALSQSLAEPYAIPYMKKILSKHRNIQFHLKFTTTPGIKRFVEEKTSHLGITLDDGSLDYFSKEIIDEGHFVFVGYKKEQIKDGLICTDNRKEIYKIQGEYQKKYKTPLPIKMRVDSWGISLRLAEEGLGIAYIPEFILKLKTESRIKKIDLGLPPVSYSVVIIQHPNEIEHPAAQMVMKYLN